MLADTNRFPVSSDRWHEIDLPDGMAGFRTAHFSLTDKNGKFDIFNVELRKVLSAEADDNDLRREFKSAVDMVGKLLGVELKCPELRDIDDWNRRPSDVRRMMKLGTELRIRLADGYSVKVAAQDANYVKRNGNFCPVSGALVEVMVRNDYAEVIPGVRRRFKKEDAPVAIERELEFGADLSGQLSEATKEAASGRGSKRKQARWIKNLTKKAESGDIEAMDTLRMAYQYGGFGVKEDQSLAFKYSKMAADAGDVKGITALAACYEEGIGTEQNVVKAAELWKKAAEMGDALAVARYATCLAEGKGVEKDTAKAKEYIEKGLGECKNRNCNLDDLKKMQKELNDVRQRLIDKAKWKERQNEQTEND